MAGIFHHIGLSFQDYEGSRGMYIEALKPLGIKLLSDLGDANMSSLGPEEGQNEFWIAKVQPGKPGLGGSYNIHVAFNAKSEEEVQAFHEAALAAGFQDNGKPGPRPQYFEGYYGAFVLDKQGNNIEAVHLPFPRTGALNHVAIGVDDYQKARPDYLKALQPLGVKLFREIPGKDVCGLSSDSGAHGFWLAQARSGKTSKGLNAAFNGQSQEEVKGFYKAAKEAGFDAYGEPKPIPEYHESYYGAFALDSGGHNIHVCYDPKVSSN